MRFADIFLSTRHIKVSELNFKRPIVTRKWHCVQTSVYTLPAVTEVARLIPNWAITDRVSHQPLPNYNSFLPVQGAKSFLFLFLHHFIIFQFSIILDPFLSTLPVLKLNKVEFIIEILFGLIDKYRCFGLTYRLLLRDFKLGFMFTTQWWQSPNPDSKSNHFFQGRSQNCSKCLLNSQ
jgi:hypothetical protein